VHGRSVTVTSKPKNNAAAGSGELYTTEKDPAKSHTFQDLSFCDVGALCAIRGQGETHHSSTMAVRLVVPLTGPTQASHGSGS
jgi:hypothetical protein